MNIRRLVVEDGLGLYELWLRGIEAHPAAFGSTVDEFRQTSPTGFIEQNLTKPERFVVLGAVVKRELVGFVALARDRRTKLRHTATLGPIYVIPEMRNQGVGVALVQAALAYLQALPEMTNLKLTVAVGNSAARHLYRRCGFIPYGVEPNGMQVDGHYVDMESLARSIP